MGVDCDVSTDWSKIGRDGAEESAKKKIANEQNEQKNNGIFLLLLLVLMCVCCVCAGRPKFNL